MSADTEKDDQRLVLHQKELISTIEKGIKTVTDHVTAYDPKQVHDWSNTIIETILKDLAMKQNNKYVVTCAIMQRNGAEMHISRACHWSDGDQACSLRWSNHPLMHVVVTVFAVST